MKRGVNGGLPQASSLENEKKGKKSLERTWLRDLGMFELQKKMSLWIKGKETLKAETGNDDEESGVGNTFRLGLPKN